MSFLYMSTLDDENLKRNKHTKKHSVCFETKDGNGVLGEGNTYVEAIDNAKLTIKKLQEEMLTFEPMFIETEIMRKDRKFLIN